MDFNKKPHRLVAYKLAPARHVERREDGMLLGPPGAGESHLAQAHALSAIQKGYRFRYSEAHVPSRETRRRDARTLR
ncbi:MAG: ATP-binding protein [Deltaproteobacteria bacterium]|nr:ATP-binding protein [Deltaproteobacteria bacterium]